MNQAIVIRKRTSGPDADRILDQLEDRIEWPGERLQDGRRYNLEATRDWVIAVAAMKAQLDGISESWPVHLEFEPPE